MKDIEIIKSILGKAPWKVWKGVGSFLLFEFGRKHRDVNGNEFGSQTLWIYMAGWSVRRKGKELAHSESPDQRIKITAKRLVGQRFKSVWLKKIFLKDAVRHAALFSMDNGYALNAYMYINYVHQ